MSRSVDLGAELSRVQAWQQTRALQPLQRWLEKMHLVWRYEPADDTLGNTLQALLTQAVRLAWHDGAKAWMTHPIFNQSRVDAASQVLLDERDDRMVDVVWRRMSESMQARFAVQATMMGWDGRRDQLWGRMYFGARLATFVTLARHPRAPAMPRGWWWPDAISDPGIRQLAQQGEWGRLDALLPHMASCTQTHVVEMAAAAGVVLPSLFARELDENMANAGVRVAPVAPRVRL